MEMVTKRKHGVVEMGQQQELRTKKSWQIDSNKAAKLAPPSFI